MVTRLNGKLRVTDTFIFQDKGGRKSSFWNYPYKCETTGVSSIIGYEAFKVRTVSLFFIAEGLPAEQIHIAGGHVHRQRGADRERRADPLQPRVRLSEHDPHSPHPRGTRVLSPLFFNYTQKNFSPRSLRCKKRAKFSFFARLCREKNFCFIARI